MGHSQQNKLLRESQFNNFQKISDFNDLITYSAEYIKWAKININSPQKI